VHWQCSSECKNEWTPFQHSEHFKIFLPMSSHYVSSRCSDIAYRMLTKLIVNTLPPWNVKAQPSVSTNQSRNSRDNQAEKFDHNAGRDVELPWKHFKWDHKKITMPSFHRGWVPDTDVVPSSENRNTFVSFVSSKYGLVLKICTPAHTHAPYITP
jgi:hypothetical protein